MKYEKDYIIREIIRTAKENNNKPLGKGRFYEETGIKEGNWYGRYWARWGDALTEVGYKPNQFGEDSYDNTFLIVKLIELIRELNKFLTVGELRLKKKQDDTFPSASTYQRFGSHNEKIAKVIEYYKNLKGMTDILKICSPLLQNKKEKYETSDFLETANFGFVYLIKSGKFYKIGRSNVMLTDVQMN